MILLKGIAYIIGYVLFGAMAGFFTGILPNLLVSVLSGEKDGEITHALFFLGASQLVRRSEF